MWNYRICKEMTKVGEYYSIRECYYWDKKHPDKVTAWVAECCSPVGDTVKELKADFKLMAQALKQPVIDIGKTKDAPATLKAKNLKGKKNEKG
jgi:hypothetical protein